MGTGWEERCGGVVLHQKEMFQLVVVKSLSHVTLASYISLTKKSAMCPQLFKAECDVFVV